MRSNRVDADRADAARLRAARVDAARVVGVVLAAGAGARMGRPKALVHRADGRSWLDLSVTALLDGGCAEVVVVLGAADREARALVPARPTVRSVVAVDWARGPSASLRAGLAAARATGGVDAVLVSLVDLPGLPAGAVRRVLADAAGSADAAGPGDTDRPGDAAGPGAAAGSAAIRASLRRASYDGRPGHPVLVGRDHWEALTAALAAPAAEGDRGAGPWLRAAGVEPVECGDLWDGADRDHPGPDLRGAPRPSGPAVAGARATT
ncbi:NTP transferase domain-containing protein [Curtobacterium aetherium]|uniref:nucleotidyltransferase family protein n=1 Tax=Curtobacterium aetherium TaxID=2841594 RepID=UPI003B51CD87